MILIKPRLTKLRQHMQLQQIDLYLVPSIDPHCNEYVPECWLRRPWISGFNGSAGEALVATDHAYLWTDGRYYLQAEQQLDLQEYTLMHQSGFTPETENWLATNAHGKTLAVDPQLISINRAFQLQKIMEDNSGKLFLLEDNLIDKCRLELSEDITSPTSSMFILDEQYTGQSLAQKLIWLRTKLSDNKVDYIVLSVLDEIAWLFNLRGADVTYNPLTISYCIIGVDSAWLFVDTNKINSQVITYLNNCGVEICNYTYIDTKLKSLSGTIWLDGKTASHWIYSKINSNNKFKLYTSPIIHQKACKNKTEASGAINAHLKDAVALIGFFNWLDKNWTNGTDEISCIEKIAEFRSKQENLIGASFETKSAFASNAAIIHYDATTETNKTVDDSSLYLLDSGGQYLEGTTDVTRTIHLGNPTEIQKRHYTLVLKGHLALGRAVFSHGTCGEHLDALARTYLWNDYLNYRHGTGHGVGSFLCVHEGPHKISQVNTGVALIPGMIVSNEPGLYLSGQYGIRIENLCLIVEVDSSIAKSSEYGPFYRFETLTLAPYCKKLIDQTLLSAEDKQQILDYYSVIRTKITPFLNHEEQAWLDSELNLSFS